MKIAAPLVMLLACGQTRAGVPSLRDETEYSGMASTNSNGPVQVQDCAKETKNIAKWTECKKHCECCMNQMCLSRQCQWVSPGYFEDMILA
ncbi:hypothetical protein CDD80_7362 [Ophiocordyceps camponoti-rufipedis]|uniref:PSI domain-containing protein n=1 Tax=Ophiocordyceps camponoti-rufipedis TaxID=2004952 RepID=A0A2C5XRZ1_9HYPO|nr:hypothetical protein CDD80_7362 [Ophiocordyceps camponoti-rufipedis]